MRICDSPGKVILVNHSILIHEMGLQNLSYQFPQEWYDKIRGSVQLKSHRVRLCNLGIAHPRTEYHQDIQLTFSPTFNFQKNYTIAGVDNHGNNIFHYLLVKVKPDAS